MAEPQDGLVEDLKKALHHAQQNNEPEQARHLARLLTEALNPRTPDARTHSDSRALRLRGWPLRGNFGSKEWRS